MLNYPFKVVRKFCPQQKLIATFQIQIVSKAFIAFSNETLPIVKALLLSTFARSISCKNSFSNEQQLINQRECVLVNS